MLHVNFGITRTYYEQFDCDISHIENAISEARTHYSKNCAPSLNNMDLLDEDWEIICDDCGSAIEFNRMVVCGGRIVCPQCQREYTRFAMPVPLSENRSIYSANLLLDYLRTYNVQSIFSKRDEMKNTQSAIDATIAALAIFGIECTTFTNADGSRYVSAKIDDISYDLI